MFNFKNCCLVGRSLVSGLRLLRFLPYAPMLQRNSSKKKAWLRFKSFDSFNLFVRVKHFSQTCRFTCTLMENHCEHSAFRDKEHSFLFKIIILQKANRQMWKNTDLRICKISLRIKCENVYGENVIIIMLWREDEIHTRWQYHRHRGL